MVEVKQEREPDAENVEKSPKKAKLSACATGLNEKISKQLEYYFSDVNVIRDKFLKDQFGKNDGWVKLSVLLTFARLKQLTTEEDQIVEALKGFQSEVIEFDEVKRQVRRKHPIPDAEEFQKQLDMRTVHISGFPTDYNFDMLESFCSTYGELESLNMRLHFKTRFFKGCIHVVFKDEADAKKVLEQKELKCKDRELKTESMVEYRRRKAEIAEKVRQRRNKGKVAGDD